METTERITQDQVTRIEHIAGELQAVIDGTRTTGWGSTTDVEANLRDLAEALIRVSQQRYPETFREWLESELEDYIEDIYRHGVDQGYPHLTYWYHMVPIYDRYESEIWDALVEDADAYGYKTVPEFIASWRRNEATEDAIFKGYLVWYMAERTAREIVEDAEVNG